MKFLTWNVNGIRAIQKKGFEEIISILDPDFVCLQETKAQPEQIDLEDFYPYEYINSAKKKGYSGTMIMSYDEPLNVFYGIGQEEHDQEGRVITLEYENYYLINVYIPNAGENLKRLEYRKEWDIAFGKYIKSLDKPILLCGDFNVAIHEIDVYDPNAAQGHGGYTDEERQGFQKNLLSDLVDIYRLKHPEERKYTWWSYYERGRERGEGWRIDEERQGFQKNLLSDLVDIYRLKHPEERKYTWWSYYERGRERGEGWRIDYWLISPSLVDKVRSVKILDDIYGSDHCPVLLDIDL